MRGESFVVAGPPDDAAGQLHLQWRPGLPGQEGGGADGLQEAAVQEGAGQPEAGARREHRHGLLLLPGGGGEPEAWRQHLHPHHDVLLREGLHGADVGPGVGRGDGVDDEDPVVGGLVQHGVPQVPAEGEVAHSEQVQGGVRPRHGPGHQPQLQMGNIRIEHVYISYVEIH